MASSILSDTRPYCAISMLAIQLGGNYHPTVTSISVPVTLPNIRSRKVRLPATYLNNPAIAATAELELESARCCASCAAVWLF